MKLRGIVAANIRSTAAAKGLSLSRLAELAGCSHATVTWAAKGQSSLTLDSLAKICGALDLEPYQILVEKPEEPKKTTQKLR
jgi:transcriptional regulator with XRE-family HTH domain